MTIVAKRAGRIDVWPTWDDARDADTEDSKLLRNMTIWGTMREAQENIETSGDGIPDNVLTLDSDYLTLGADYLVLEG